MPDEKEIQKMLKERRYTEQVGLSPKKKYDLNIKESNPKEIVEGS